MESQQKLTSEASLHAIANSIPDVSVPLLGDRESLPIFSPNLAKVPENSNFTVNEAAEQLGARIRHGPRASSMRILRGDRCFTSFSQGALKQTTAVAPSPTETSPIRFDEKDEELKRPCKSQSMRYTPRLDMHQGLKHAREFSWTGGCAVSHNQTPVDSLSISSDGQVVVSKTYVWRENEVASLECGKCGRQLGVVMPGTLLGNCVLKFCQTCHPLPPPPSAWRCTNGPTTPKKRPWLIHCWRRIFHLEKLRPSYMLR